MKVIDDGSIHEFEEMTPEKRPQDPHGNGAGLTFETLEHGVEYPDTMPQAIRLTDAQGRSCMYFPARVGGRVVDSKGFTMPDPSGWDLHSTAEDTTARQDSSPKPPRRK